MIDEKKLIAKLEEWAKESKEESGLKEPALLRKVIEEVKSMAVNEEIKARIEREEASDSGWIPVSKHLPENDDDVIVTAQGHSGRFTDVDYYDLDAESWELFSNQEEVIAWMPLPEPYIREESK